MNRLLFFLVFILCAIPVYAENPVATAEFAGGGFWYMEHDFETVQGVMKVVAGYTGGSEKNPTYEDIINNKTGHYETVQVIYNPLVISYRELLNVFWHNVDPTDADGQFCDRGRRYRAAIFYATAEEKKLAEKSKEELIKSERFKAVFVPILPATTFYPANEAQQKYATRNPLRYRYYRYRCGRDQRLKVLWGKV